MIDASRLATMEANVRPLMALRIEGLLTRHAELNAVLSRKEATAWVWADTRAALAHMLKRLNGYTALDFVDVIVQERALQVLWLEAVMAEAATPNEEISDDEDRGSEGSRRRSAGSS